MSAKPATLTCNTVVHRLLLAVTISGLLAAPLAGQLPGPGGLAAAATSTTTARLTWLAGGKIFGYQVVRYRSDNLKTPEFTSPQLGSATGQWDDTGLTPGVTYQYVVAAIYSRGSGQSVISLTMPAIRAITDASTSLTTRTQLSTLFVPPPPPAEYTLSTTSTTPTGPAPAGFTVSGTPMVAQLRWSAATGVTSYAIWRTDGSGGTTSQRTPNGFAGTALPDTVPDPRLSYYYRLAVNYSNGTWGEARTTFVSPAPTNPTSLTATSLAPGAFRLSWPAVAGAVRYRVDGATLPNTGELSLPPLLYYNVINVPPGPQSWQVVALFPNGVADYNNPTKTSAVSRVLPTHPPFLVKNNGTGNATYATAHAAQLCPDNNGGTTTYGRCSIGQILQNYGTGYKLFTTYAGLEEVPYTNVTELGGARSTACKEGVAKGERFTVCYTISGSSASVIVKGSKGTRFGTLQQQNGAYWDEMWGLVTTATLDGAGARATPHACLSCHGGVYDPRTGLVQGATLLPIDPGLVTLTNRAAQEEPIRKINALILMSGASEAVAKYINGMYGGNALIAGAVAAPNYVPPGWATDANFYTGLVKKNCAMCHLAVQNGTDFLSVGNFLQFKDLIYNSVCKAKAMPHAEVPYARFWTEDTGPVFVPGLLAARLGFPSCP